MFNPIICHTHYSIGRALGTPTQIVKRASELDYPTLGITDDNSLSGAVTFFKETKKQGIKPLLGCKFENYTLIAKNKRGWQYLLKHLSEGYQYPISKNVICILGRMGTELSKKYFTLPDIAFNLKTENNGEIFSHVNPNRDYEVEIELQRYIERVGKENIFLEVQLHDRDNLPTQAVLSQLIRQTADYLGLQCVATTNPHYPSSKIDVEDHRLLLCIHNRKKLSEAEDIGYFASRNYYLHSKDEINEMEFLEEEIKNTQLISDMCEEYDILSSPLLPKFNCPNNLSDDEYLIELCRQGWKNKGFKNNQTEYIDRIKKELEVIRNAGLSSYFLIVQDYVKDAKKRGLCGVGRGSSAGSLISYLLEITDIDPIKYGLFFERFYNEGRNTKDRVALPDIDVDFEIDKRQDTINYIKDKYGHDKVVQLITFGRLMGRGALKDVLRTHGACSFSEMNKITAPLPSDSAISDELELMRKEDRKPSIIQWSLENKVDELKEWCYLDKNGKYQGEYSKLFEQAYRLEGTYKASSKHPAAVIISSNPIIDHAPLIKDKSSNEMICAFEMEESKEVGLVKFDILGTVVLDKLSFTEKLINQR